MAVDYGALTAWAAVAAALAAVAALIIEGRRFRFSLGVDLILRLNSYFDSTDFKRVRQKAAREMKAGALNGASDVFNFLEVVGMFTRRGALDKKAVWSMYSYWVYYYWHAGKDYISIARPTAWKDFTYLYRIIMEIDRRERGACGMPQQPEQEDIDEFLEEEAGLVEG